MIDGKTVLAIIPARGGSKGIPQKNLALLQGKPLIAWSIEIALQSKLIDNLVVSSDDKDIISAAQKFGCKHIVERPEHLSTDEAKTVDVLVHTLGAYPGYDLLVLLQPTSPLRIVEDIEECIKKTVQHNAPTASVTESDKNPNLFFKISEGKLKPLGDFESLQKRRQELDSFYIPNGAVYCSYTQQLLKGQTFWTPQTIPHIMPKNRSVDIDTPLDLMLAAAILNSR